MEERNVSDTSKFIYVLTSNMCVVCEDVRSFLEPTSDVFVRDPESCI